MSRATAHNETRRLIFVFALLVMLLVGAVLLLIRNERRPAAYAQIFRRHPQTAGTAGSESLGTRMRGGLRALYGQRLAGAHCGTCHLLPAPDALPTRAWPVVLRNMAARMGGAQVFPELGLEERGLIAGLAEAGQLQKTTTLSSSDWLALSEYYYRWSTAELRPLARPPLTVTTQTFRPQVVLQETKGAATDVTLVQIQPGRVLAGTITTFADPGVPADFQLTEFRPRPGGRSLNMSPAWFRAQSRKLPSAAIALLEEQRATPLVGLLGGPPAAIPGMILPLSAAVQLFDRTGPGVDLESSARSRSRALFQAPERIAHALIVRFGGENRIAISAFGSFRGGLFLVPPGQERGQATEAQALLALRGIVAAAGGDFNGDGHPDIAALSAQDREGLHLFYGPTERGGTPGTPPALPRATTALERGPQYGFTGLVAFDLDGDQRMDLAIANGDNGDFMEAGPKPYHGVSILRSGERTLEEVYRLPLYGATRIAAGDLDGDGRTDLVVTALYPAIGTPFAKERAVVMFNRALDASKGKTASRPVTQMEAQLLPIPEGFRPGVLHISDLDGDGDLDIVMGALPYLSDPSGQRQPSDKRRPLIVFFENTRENSRR